MDEDLYDEFGNYIGEEASLSGSDVESDVSLTDIKNNEIAKDAGSELTVAAPNLLTTYDSDVEVLVETQDRDDIGAALVEPEDHRRRVENAVFTQLNKNIPKASYDRNYMLELASSAERCMTVCFLGPLHSGKTSLVDLLACQSHEKLPHISKPIKDGWKPLKYTDNMKVEIQRGVSMKLNGFTFLGQDFTGKSQVITLLDTPGHTNFVDEAAVAMAASDCCVIVIDVVEGVSSITEFFIKQAQKMGLPIIFVLAKIDRLVLELRLPPKDAHLKLQNTVEQINSFTKMKYSPELGNVVFSSAQLGITFTIKEFVKYYYSERLGSEVDSLVDRLWGSVYFDKGHFSTTPNAKKETSFVQFILSPIYKLITHTLSLDFSSLKHLLKQQFEITLDKASERKDPLPLLRHVMKLVFHDEVGFIDAIIKHGQSSVFFSSSRVPSEIEGTVIHILKLLDYRGELWSLGRVYRGTIRCGDKYTLINDSQDATSIDEDELAKVKVDQMGLLGGRYILPVTQASTGQIVLIKGLEKHYLKSATLYSKQITSFPPIDYLNEQVFKVVIQPHHPRELSKLLEGLGLVHKLYPGITVKVEESGEHVIFGSGELYLDTVLYELRHQYAKIEIKVSMPLVKFSEGCTGESFAAIPITSSSGSLKISIGAKPLQKEIIRDMTKGLLQASEIENVKLLAKKLRNEYGWDSFAARNVHCFHNCNVFVDDTLPDEVDKELVTSVMHHIIQGFKWFLSEGPLAEEPVYGVNFNLLNLQISDDKNCSAAQLIPLVRKACSVALLTAEPILLEPIYEVDIHIYEALIPIVEELFKKRRGSRIYKIEHIAATPLVEIKGQMPVLGSIGFETDLRLAANGMGMCQLHFFNKIWRKVPGDVMNEDAVIPKLKPAPINSLARDFVMKTRRRKGLSAEGYHSNDGPSLKNYLDIDLFNKLKESGYI
ncbi:HDL384Wp [Eremothecium sinecaudum]|uniref:HDL384Wp n=1 Tax=Eremothecium sinecaudum TaxID=45286 RepID=A0A0X8HRZ2_9SACH|nr:HDL384Wp [Eremothecium sinecaudum]AMD20360.1 HDL384Wp [Eremothecium sinecaudum]